MEPSEVRSVDSSNTDDYVVKIIHAARSLLPKRVLFSPHILNEQLLAVGLPAVDLTPSIVVLVTT